MRNKPGLFTINFENTHIFLVQFEVGCKSLLNHKAKYNQARREKYNFSDLCRSNTAKNELRTI